MYLGEVAWVVLKQDRTPAGSPAVLCRLRVLTWECFSLLVSIIYMGNPHG